jgi:hypothetical protein
MNEKLTGQETPCVIVYTGDKVNTWKIKIVERDDYYVFPSSKLRHIQPCERRMHKLNEEES